MIGHDLHNAWRRLTARPAHTVLSMSILGLGLGVMLFLLSVANGAILAPLPFADSERLVAVGEMTAGDNGVGRLDSEDHERLSRELASFEQIASWNWVHVTLGWSTSARRYAGASLSADLLPLLGVEPVLGRGFTAEDDRPGSAAVVLIGHDVWRNDFEADPGVIGRTVRINGQPGTVIGVMPEQFGFPVREEVWVPRRLQAGDGLGSQFIGRLRADVGVEQARLELEAVSQRLGRDLKALRENQQLVLKPWAMRFITESIRQTIWLMFSTGALVLLLACVNVANLQLVQTMGRRRELAVRSALGAGRGRLLRELLIESLLLSLAATLIALALAEAGGRWLHATFLAAEGAPPYYVDFGTDLRMLGFAALAALITTLVAGLLPAARASSTDVQQTLRDGGRGASGRGLAGVTKGLVVAEIGLTVVLLVGAGVFIREVGAVLDADFGTRSDPDRIATGQLALPRELYPNDADRVRHIERVVERLQADPSVVSASAASIMPGFDNAGYPAIHVEGGPRPEQGFRRAHLGHVDEHFARTYGLQVSAGRWFDSRDQADAEPVAVINQRLAQALWPQGDPLDNYLLIDPEGAEPTRVRVVGLLEHLHLASADTPLVPTVLLPLHQHPTGTVTLAVHTRGPAEAFAPRMLELVLAENADTPLYRARSQRRAIEMGRIGPVVLSQIFSGIGLLALALAAAGLYGVLAFAVAQRTREIGIRRAVGAGRSAIVASIGRRVVWQIALGLSLGVLVALPWSRLLASAQTHAQGHDPAVFALVIATVVLVAVLAALTPLRRALRVDPVVTLRHE